MIKIIISFFLLSTSFGLLGMHHKMKRKLSVLKKAMAALNTDATFKIDTKTNHIYTSDFNKKKFVYRIELLNEEENQTLTIHSGTRPKKAYNSRRDSIKFTVFNKDDFKNNLFKKTMETLLKKIEQGET